MLPKIDKIDIEILKILARKIVCLDQLIRDLNKRFKVKHEKSRISRRCKKLVSEGLIIFEKEGRFKYFALISSGKKYLEFDGGRE